MTKADIVSRISEKLGIEKGDVQATVESFMEEVKNSLESGDNVYLRGFGSFIIKKRALNPDVNVVTLRFNPPLEIPLGDVIYSVGLYGLQSTEVLNN